MPDGSGSPLPSVMFEFTEEELSLNPDIESVLIPAHIVPVVDQNSNNNINTSNTAIDTTHCDDGVIDSNSNNVTA
jgi:hypothetical protein